MKEQRTEQNVNETAQAPRAHLSLAHIGMGLLASGVILSVAVPMVVVVGSQVINPAPAKACGPPVC
jgi:hypothetical protein